MLRPVRTRGFTLLEVAFSAGLVLLILVPVFAALVGSNRTVASSRLQKIAVMAAQARLERLRSEALTDFVTFPALYDEALDTTPPFTSTERQFFVAGLPPRPNGEPHGLVTLFMDEDDAANPFGSLDLNGDGDTADDMTTTDFRFRVVPVRVEVRWGANNQQGGSVVINSVITQNNNFNRQTS